jgi:hypothetical protein
MPDTDVSIALACRGCWRILEPKQASLTLAFPLRWRVVDAGVEKGAKMGFSNAGVSIALACGVRRHVKDTGVEKGARIGFYCAGASIALAYAGRWR